MEDRKVTIALISLYDVENNAVRSISATLRKSGYRAIEIYFKDWVNNKLVWPRDTEIANLIALLQEEQVGIVGISLRASAYFEVARFIIEKIKLSLSIPVLLGGVHPTSEPEKCIAIADIICRGESETAILELVKKISKGEKLNTIPNLWMRTDAGIQRNDVRPLISNLDSLPFFDYSNRDKYFIEGKRVSKEDPLLESPVISFRVSRGCFFNCSFCHNSVLRILYQRKGKFFRCKSVDSAIAELQEIKAKCKNLKKVRFDDEIFIFDQVWLEKFCEEYGKKIALPFECFIYPGKFDEALWVRLKKSGLKAVNIGVENSSEINRRLYNRNFMSENILEISAILHKLKIEVHYQILLDDPVSSESDRRELFEFLMKLPRPLELYLFSLTLFPGSELTKKLLTEGIIKDSDVEGAAAKTFRQFRVDLNYPRSKEELFWASIYVLISKKFIPKKIIRVFAGSAFFRKNPNFLACIAQISNIIKMACVVSLLIMRKEINSRIIRKWLNLNSLITQ